MEGILRVGGVTNAKKAVPVAATSTRSETRSETKNLTPAASVVGSVAPPASVSRPVVKSSSVYVHLGGSGPAVDLTSEMNILQPPDRVHDLLIMKLNNLTMKNVVAISKEMGSALKPEYHHWLANYLVTNRVGTQANYHAAYFTMIDALKSKPLWVIVLKSTILNVSSQHLQF